MEKHPCRIDRPHGAPHGRRTAFTLIEMVVVMTIASAMIGLAGMMIHRLLATEHDVTRATRFVTTVSRLSRAFRADVHAARAIELAATNDGQPAALILAFTDRHQAQYQLEANRASRIESENGNVLHREDFLFPPGSRLKFARDPETGLAQFELNLAGSGRGPQTGPGRFLVIEAVAGRDHRFEPLELKEGRQP